MYPPIVVGDLNFGADYNPPTVEEVEGNFPRDRMAAWYPENVGVVTDRPKHFRTKQHVYTNQMAVIPPTIPCQTGDRDPATLWSYHCGFYFRVEPSP